MHHVDLTIVGGGAAGVLLYAHLGDHADVAIVDAGPGSLGAGTAYRTDDPAHSMNVRAGSLSAYADYPGDFTRWLGPDGSPDAYEPRTRFGAYLADVAKDAPHVAARAVDLHRRPAGRATDGGHWLVRLDTGATITSRHVVLATGIEPPSLAWAPRSIAEAPRFVADPWRPGALDPVGAGDPVLIIGTGLTAVDVALTLGPRTRRCITAVSRHGLLPRAHADVATAPMPVDAAELPDSLAALRVLVRARIRASIAATGDWRPAIDGLRSVTAAIWTSLPDADRAAFVRHDVRRWEIARHRMAPAVADQIAELRGDGRLRVMRSDAAAAIAAAGPDTWIINATSPESRLTRSGNPLLRRLLTTGLVRPGPLGIGLSTTPAGAIRDRSDHTLAGAWTLGCPRRGQLWETTAIPEIRAQAAALATAIRDPDRLGTGASIARARDASR